MEAYSRPATLEDLKTLIGALNRQHVDYLLIGGYVLFAHGYSCCSRICPACARPQILLQ